MSSGVYIQSLTEAANGYEDMALAASTYDFAQGNVGIGTTSPGYTLEVKRTVAIDGLTSWSTGDFVCINTTTHQLEMGTSCSRSSEWFKTGITPLPEKSGLSEVPALNPVSFSYKKGCRDSRQKLQIGFVAEQAAKVDPRLVVFDGNGKPSGFEYATYTAILTKAVQEAAGSINELHYRLNGAEAKIQAHRKVIPILVDEVKQLKAANGRSKEEIAKLTTANDHFAAAMGKLEKQVGDLQRKIAVRTAEK